MISFLDLPGEIRNMVYRQLIVTGVPVSRWVPSTRPCLHVNLLYTNKQIYHEYGTLVYSGVTFDFLNYTHDRTVRLLDQIGQNAKHIRRIFIEFPKVIETDNKFVFDKESTRIFDKLQNACPGLEQLHFGPACMFDIRVRSYVKRPEKTDKIASLIVDRLKSFSSLESIEVNVPSCQEYDYIMSELEDRYGWYVYEVEDWYDSSEEDDVDGEMDENSGGSGDDYSEYSGGSGEYDSDYYCYSSRENSSEEDDEYSSESSEDDCGGYRGSDNGFGEDENDYDNADDGADDSGGDEEFRQDDIEDSHPTGDYLHMQALSSQQFDSGL